MPITVYGTALENAAVEISSPNPGEKEGYRLNICASSENGYARVNLSVIESRMLANEILRLCHALDIANGIEQQELRLASDEHLDETEEE